MAGLYYEQFSPTRRSNTPGPHVTEMDNVLFSSLTMSVSRCLDAHFAAQTEFGKPLVNNLFTLGLLIGMTVNDTTLGTTIANLGMTDVAFPKPVYAGDTLHVRTRVVSTRDSKSRPDAGIVEFEHTALNHRDETVAVCKRAALMRKRPVQERS